MLTIYYVPQWSLHTTQTQRQHYNHDKNKTIWIKHYKSSQYPVSISSQRSSPCVPCPQGSFPPRVPSLGGLIVQYFTSPLWFWTFKLLSIMSTFFTCCAVISLSVDLNCCVSIWRDGCWISVSEDCISLL